MLAPWDDQCSSLSVHASQVSHAVAQSNVGGGTCVMLLSQYMIRHTLLATCYNPDT